MSRKQNKTLLSSILNMSDFVTMRCILDNMVDSVGDKGVFVIPVVMMNFGDRVVFVRIPFHSDTLPFWAF